MMRPLARSRFFVVAITVLTAACATTPKKHDKHLAKKTKKHPTEQKGGAENYGLYQQSKLNSDLIQRGQKNNGPETSI